MTSYSICKLHHRGISLYSLWQFEVTCHYSALHTPGCPEIWWDLSKIYLWLSWDLMRLKWEINLVVSPALPTPGAGTSSLSAFSQALPTLRAGSCHAIKPQYISWQLWDLCCSGIKLQYIPWQLPDLSCSGIKKQYIPWQLWHLSSHDIKPHYISWQLWDLSCRAIKLQYISWQLQDLSCHEIYWGWMGLSWEISGKYIS